jgi:hypothetical protein
VRSLKIYYFWNNLLRLPGVRALLELSPASISMRSISRHIAKYKIVNGRAKPGQIVSHHIDIQEAPDAYEKFDKRIEGYTKVLIRFDQKRAA